MCAPSPLLEEAVQVHVLQSFFGPNSLYISQIADLRYCLHPELHGKGPSIPSTTSAAAWGLKGMGATTPEDISSG